MAYATTALVKTYLDITGSGDDTLIGTLIDRAQKIIEESVGFVFEGSNANRSFDVDKDTDGEMLFFDTWCASINTVTNNADASSPETITSSKYITLPRNAGPYYGIRLLASANTDWTYTTDPEAGITINGVWAYSASAPNDIVHATIRLAGWLYRQRESSGEGDRPLIVEGVTILPSQLPHDVREIVSRYQSLSAWQIASY